MKRFFTLVFVFLIYISINVAQQTYTVDIPGESHFVKWYSHDNSFVSGSGYLGAGVNGYTWRSYIIWNNIHSYVPANRQLAEVKFIITWAGHYSTAQIEYHDFSFGVGLPQTYSNIGTGTLWSTSPATITEYSFTQLTDKVQAAVNGSSNEVHIGIKNQNEQDYNYYVSFSYNVSLSVTYYSDQITVTQIDKDGTPFGQVGKRQGTDWIYTDVPFNLTLSPGSNLGLQSSQAFKPNTNQKYWQWIQNEDVVIPNHQNFTTISTGDYFKASFYPSYEGVTIQNSLEGTSLNIGNINFADPWYIDYADPLFGNSVRNRGMKETGTDALQYRSRTSPFYPDNTTVYQNGSDPSHSYQGVFLNQDPTFDPDIPNYSVQAVNGDIPMGGKYGTRPFYFQRWVESDGIQYEHSGNATTGVVFTSSGATATAVMKGHLLSDKATAFASNGQRNLLRDASSIYHLFYISMYKIWHTHSLTSDFNGAWSQEEEVPLCYGANIPVSLSVDYNGSDQIAIVYVDETAYMWHTIINKNTGEVIETHSYEDVTLDYNYINSVLPVVAFSPNQLIVVYKPSASSGLYFARKYRIIDTWTYQEGIQILNTDFTSLNPTIASIKDGSASDIFFLAFQRGNINTTINYCEVSMANPLNFNISTISTGSGYAINYSPSISLYRSSNQNVLYKPMVSWTARNGGEIHKLNFREGTQVPEPRMVCRQKNSDNSWGSCFVAGENVNYSYNNSVTSSTINQSVITWSESNGTIANWVRRDGTAYSVIFCLEPAGLIPNVTTGINFLSIKAFTFDPSVMPSILNPGNTDFSGTPDCGGITKDASIVDLTYSRSGVILKNGIEFVFNTGDIIVDDSVVKFIEMPDTLVCQSISQLNQTLRTENFNLTESSSLLFTNCYYVINKEGADSLLSENESVSFKLELVNSLTREVAGTFDDITYSRTNLDDYENISYQVDCSGIPDGSYFLRIVTEETGEAEYSLINTLNDGCNLGKKYYNKVLYTGSGVPITYELSQNFPNPFNPATTINYQLPQTGFVTLTVYDILGKEVITLVNEQKTQGRYSVNFDASRLASGVYIYQIRVNDYVSSKKILLLK